jgi:HlyD family secretion protein
MKIKKITLNILQKVKILLLKFWQIILRHKIKSVIIFIIFIIAGYFGYNYFNKESSETKYILTSVTKGTITTTVSGTGQVQAETEKNVSADASGKVIYLNPNIKVGNTISKGTQIATIDNSDALNDIEDAEENLETAKIDLDDLIGANESNPKVTQDAKEDLEKAYEDGYNTVSSVFLDLPSVMKNLEDILYGNAFDRYQQNIDYYTYNLEHQGEDSNILNFRKSTIDSYNKARDAYEKNFDDYKKSSIYSTDQEIDSLISQTYETSKLISQSVKDAINFIQFYEDVLTRKNIPINNTIDTHISNLSSYLSTTNSDVSSLFNTKSNIKNGIEAIDDCANQIRTAQLNVKSKENALQNAKDKLNDYYIYANLTGVISAVNIESGENVSSGSNVVTIITTSKIAAITLSEADIVGIKTGNKAKVTFDAIEGLEIEGQVSQVDSAGSASSGVVSYGLEIAFDTDNEDVKPGMSVSATIIKNSKENVLILPSAAVKEGNNGYYVQTLDEKYDLTNRSISIKGIVSDTLPTIQNIEIGLADDINTEIINGLKEGDQVILRISSGITTTSNTSNNQSGNIINVGGGGTGTRMQTGGPPGM